ncbi:MAG: hypothetical protein HYY91_05665 [Candidatus Omnitrophica bacterium]|nr:hypothetical protein [Candidatus Omnitrophota bacterium]
MGTITTTTDLSQDLGDTSTTATQQAAATSTKVADGTATWDQVRTVETGVFHYSLDGADGTFVQTKYNGSPGQNIQGHFHFRLDIDFGARTIGGGNSAVKVNTEPSGNINRTETIEAQSFASLTGDAFITDSDDAFLSGTFTLQNKDGTVAKEGSLDLTYDDGGSNAGSTNDVIIPRSSGASTAIP